MSRILCWHPWSFEFSHALRSSCIQVWPWRAPMYVPVSWIYLVPEFTWCLTLLGVWLYCDFTVILLRLYSDFHLNSLWIYLMPEPWSSDLSVFICWSESSPADGSATPIDSCVYLCPATAPMIVPPLRALADTSVYLQSQWNPQDPCVSHRHAQNNVRARPLTQWYASSPAFLSLIDDARSVKVNGSVISKCGQRWCFDALMPKMMLWCRFLEAIVSRKLRRDGYFHSKI